MWDDVVYTCRHQRPFCSESCVSNGLRTNGNRRDYVLDLDTLWRLAWGWYDRRMERATPPRAGGGVGVPTGCRTYRRVLEP